MFPVQNRADRIRFDLVKHDASAEPGVKLLHRDEPPHLLAARRAEAVAALASALGVPPREVQATTARTVDGHTRIRASWTPP